jgi:hypothetical protein
LGNWAVSAAKRKPLVKASSGHGRLALQNSIAVGMDHAKIRISTVAAAFEDEPANMGFGQYVSRALSGRERR